MSETAIREDLQSKTIRGIAWGWSSNGMNAVLSLVTLAILARLLSPKDFGLMASVTVVTNFLNVFIDMGLVDKIIQKQDSTHEELSSVFYISLMIGAVLTAIGFMSSAMVANFYQQPSLQELIWIISLSFLIVSSGEVSYALLHKRMMFDTMAKINVTKTVVYGLTAIILAYLGFGVLSLAVGLIIQSFWGTISYIVSARWKPGRWSGFTVVKEYMLFGFFASGSRLFNFLAANIDYILIGRFLGPETLGVYMLAYQLVTLPLTKISRVISNVALPAFSELQSDNARLSEFFLKITRQTSTITFPLLAGLFAVAPEFVSVVYGGKWAAMSTIIRLLCIAGALKSIGTLVSNIYVVKNKIEYAFINQLVYFISFASAIYLAIPHGINYVAASISIMQLPIFFIFQTVGNKLMQLKMKEFFLSIRAALFGSISIVVLVYALRSLFERYIGFEQVTLLALLMPLGVSIYLSYFYIVEKKSFRSLLDELRLRI